MKINMKKITVAICLLTALSFILCSCNNIFDPVFGEISKNSEIGSNDSNDLPDKNSNKGNQSPAPSDLISALPDYNFQGGAVVLATLERSPFASKKDDRVASAFSEIYSAIEKKYSTEVIVQTYATNKELYNACYASTETTGYLADLIAVPLSDLGEYINKGILQPVSTLTGTDFSSVYYNAALTPSLTINGSAWGVVGDSCVPCESSVVLYCNSELLTKAGCTKDLYQLVQNGNWTWDELLSICSQAKTSGITFGGSSLEWKNCLASLYLSLGGNLSSIDDAGNLISSVTEENSTQAAAKIAGFTGTDGTFPSGEGALSAFYNGQLLFMVGNVSDAIYLSNSVDSWSILPLPKGDPSAKEYVSPLDPDTTFVLCTLSGNSRQDISGYFMQALNAGAQYMKDTFKQSLLSDYIREGKSLPILEMIWSSQRIDSAFAYSGSGGVFEGSIIALSNTISKAGT